MYNCPRCFFTLKEDYLSIPVSLSSFCQSFLSDMLFDFFLLHLCTFRLIQGRPGPSQVVWGWAEFVSVLAHIGNGEQALSRGGFDVPIVGRVIMEVWLRVGAHSEGGRRTLRGGAAYHGQVNMLATQVSDRIAAAVGHDDVVPRTEWGGRKVLRPIRVIFGAPWWHDQGAVGSDGLHGALKGLQDALTLLLLFLLPWLHLAELPTMVSHHLFSGVGQAPK